MAYMTINGITIPVAAKSTRREKIEIGTRQRAYSGALRTDVRATKEKITCRTKAVPRDEVSAIAALVSGRPFEVVTFDGSTTSSRGVAAEGNAAIFTPAADGNAIDGATDPRDTWIIGTPATVTNLLTANESSIETSAAGWVIDEPGNGSVARTSAAAFVGTYSLVFAATHLYPTIIAVARTAGTSVSAGTYTASAYVRGTGEVDFTSRASDLSATGTTQTITLQANTWQRVSSSITVGSGKSIQLSIAEHTADSEYTCYLDAAMLETGSRANTFAAVGSARSTTSAHWLTDTLSDCPEGFAVSLWFKGHVPKTGTAETLLSCSAIAITVSNSETLTVSCGGSLSVSEDISAVIDDGDWHSVTVVRYFVAPTGSHLLEVYIDGVSVGSSDAAQAYAVTGPVDVYVGNASGSSIWDGDIGPVFMASHPYPIAWVDSIAADAATLPATQVVLSGDVVGGSTRTVRGQVEGVEDAQVWIDGSKHRAAGVLSIALEEV